MSVERSNNDGNNGLNGLADGYVTSGEPRKNDLVPPLLFSHLLHEILQWLILVTYSIFSRLQLQGYSVRKVAMKENSSVYMTLGFAGIALVAAMIVGVVVLRRRSGRNPHHQV